MEVILIVGNDIRGHTGKRDGKIFRKVKRVGIAYAEFLEQLSQVLTFDNTTGIHILLANRQACSNKIGVLLLAVADTLVAQVLLIANHVAPVLHTHQRVERVGVIADGIETTDDATHRRTRHDINGDARLLKYLQHTNMRHTLGTTATQHDGHLLSVHIRTVFLGICQPKRQHSY